MAANPKRPPMRRWLIDPVEAGALLLAMSFARALPVRAAAYVAGRATRGLGRFVGRTRQARRNLRLAMPDLTPAEVDAIIGEMWEGFGRGFAEFMHLHHLGGMSDDGRVELIGAERAQALRGGPAIMFSGHFGNWEIPATYAKRYGLTLHQVYRPLNNPLADRMFNRQRLRTGCRMIAKGSAGVRQIVQAMTDGHCIGVLIDQRLSQGVAVPFFSRPALTTPLIAKLAHRFNCPLLPVRVERLPGCRFRVTFQPSITPERPSQDNDAIRATTARMTAELEAWVRESPGQWFWLHNRWGRNPEQPPGPAPAPAPAPDRDAGRAAPQEHAR